MTTHGGSYMREYKVWVAMFQRCTNPNNDRFKDYGGRGITVCQRWQDFSLFIADMGRRPTGKLSIERRDNNGDYEPSNCCWASIEQQQNNKRTTLRLIFNGSVKTVAQWSRCVGLPRNVIGERIRMGWTVRRSLTQPVRRSAL